MRTKKKSKTSDQKIVLGYGGLRRKSSLHMNVADRGVLLFRIQKRFSLRAQALGAGSHRKQPAGWCLVLEESVPMYSATSCGLQSAATVCHFGVSFHCRSQSRFTIAAGSLFVLKTGKCRRRRRSCDWAAKFRLCLLVCCKLTNLRKAREDLSNWMTGFQDRRIPPLLVAVVFSWMDATGGN